MEPNVAQAELSTSAPFLGGGYLAEVPTLTSAAAEVMPGLVSPFSESLLGADSSRDEQGFDRLFAELEDESFDDAVEALVDEVAGLQLSSPWASESGHSPATVDAWASRVTADTHRLLEHLEERFADRSLASISAEEIDLAAAQFAGESLGPASEQLFGGILSKIKRVAGSVAKAGFAVLSKVTGLSAVTGVLKKLVVPLVRRVISFALNKLPPAAQGPARALAAKLGIQPGGSAREIATDFDRRLAEALAGANDAADRLPAQTDEAAAPEGEDPVAELDIARAELVRELASAPPGTPPVVQVEQFIPAVMAAMPLIRAATKVIGRERIKSLIATPLATFIAPLIGRQAAATLAPQLADVGLRLLKLEHEEPSTLGAEALVATLEDTVREVLSLGAESQANDLRLGAEVQEAFAEAAARYLPPQVLRRDLEAGGTEDEGGGWIMMPRAAGPHFRYRAYSRPYRITLPRPAAAVIVVGEDETLEERLLDTGVTSWPAEAEVQLFEAMPGTRLGHLAAGSAEPGSPEALPTDEFGELTPEFAGLLLGAPSLGRRIPEAAGGRLGAPAGSDSRPGQRFFRVVARGQHPRTRRRLRRLGLRLDLSAATPVLRIHLRIGERAAHA
ncbi:MAG: hypothetical protein ACRDRV_21340, partial [Pseudonocardiaceae bacterium]